MLLIFLMLCEGLVFLTTLDTKVLRHILYYMAGDVEVHRVSDDPERLFELKPGSSFLFRHATHPKEKKYIERFVGINNLGFRDKERSRYKKNGVFRIVILGGSNTYGASVSNEDTYPALLQDLFEKTHPGKVEVWNAGVSSYRLSQKVAYAEYIKKEFNPDLLIFQHKNTGRRAFLWGTRTKDIRGLLEKNRELYGENLPFLFSERHKMLRKTHYQLVSHSGLYRIFCVGIYTLMGVYKYDGRLCVFSRECDHYDDMINKRNFEEFIRKCKGIKIAIFIPLGMPTLDLGGYKDIPVFALDAKGKPDEYSALHPPSYVYEWYAQSLHDFLIKEMNLM